MDMRERGVSKHTLFQNVSKPGRVCVISETPSFLTSPSIFKLPVTFHHQNSAAGTDMAKMH